MIYADYNGSAPLLPSVKEYLHKRIDSELFANPNAIHSMGQKILGGIEKCRGIIAAAMGCYPDQIFFNSGASEGASTILRSVLEHAPKEKCFVITSAIEHPVIPSALGFYEKYRSLTVLKVEIDAAGSILLPSLEKLLNDHRGKIALVTLMAANNETGVIQPYQQIAELCRAGGVEFFCDTTQLLGKGEFNFLDSGVDYAVCSGHKLGALSGSGFLIARDPQKLLPLVFGSSQERSLRGGTQNYLGIETLAVATKDFDQNKHQLPALKAARLKFEKEMKQQFPEVIILGDRSDRLPGTTLISYPGVHGQAVQIELESQNIFVTTSAACTDNQPETSKVLKAMGVEDPVGRGVIRISLSYSHGEKEYSALAAALKAAYNKLTRIQSY
ncbi:MAG TPA: aminotransferase class V-fold PLP-dependent enzyme [Bacteriovoracaceae bacterium]|nr:aminotransferase class V-fold PLP-dependent enzyme [Bacteriovoracaceae bacterium]